MSNNKKPELNMVRVDGDSFMVSVGEFGKENANGRIYGGKEYMDGGKVAANTVSGSIQHPIKPGDFPSPGNLTMKSEYMYDVFKRALVENKDSVIEIDSIPISLPDPEIKGVHLSNKNKPVKILVVGPKSVRPGINWNEILENTKNVPIEHLYASDVHIGINGGVPVGKSTMTQPKKRVAGAVVSTGMALYTDMEGWGRQFREEPKDVVPTVKGNGRQQIVDNGKRQWPGVKTRKGHRRHA